MKSSSSTLLVLSPVVPYPPHDGDKLRIYMILKGLKKQGYVIDLFCLTRIREDLKYIDQLKLLCRRIHVSYLKTSDVVLNLVAAIGSGRSLNIWAYFSQSFRNELLNYYRSQENNITAVYCYRIRMAPYAFLNPKLSPVILDLTDCLFSYFQMLQSQVSWANWQYRILAWWEGKFLLKQEISYAQKSNRTIVISATEAAKLQNEGVPRDKIVVVPNGMDDNFKKMKFKKPLLYRSYNPVLCFVGNMGYLPNEEGALWFLKKVWPFILKKYSHPLLVLAGGHPSRKLLRHSAQNVLITGYVFEIEGYLAGASVSIAPLSIAVGMQNKIILSFLLGVPVVATSAAAAFLGPQASQWLQVEDEAEKFAAAIIAVFENSRATEARKKRAKFFALTQFSWERSMQMLRQALVEAPNIRFAE